MSREATSEQLSICEGAGYGEVFQSGHEPDEGFSWSLEREMSTHSPDEEVESYDGEEGEEEEVDEGGEDEGDEGGEEGRMTRTRVKVTREPSKVEVQEALGMGIPVHLSSPKYGPSMTSSQ